MTAEDDEMNIIGNWLCPVCLTSRNLQGGLFGGSKAVALHVAGKVLLSGDRSHDGWAVNKVGSIDEYINQYKVKRSLNPLADQLDSYVLEYNKTRRQQEEEKIKRLVQELKVKEDPSVSAYRYIQAIETSLHDFVQQILQMSFGEEEIDWWDKGVPLKVRLECVQKWEEDSEREGKYNYTNLIDLKTIIEKRWTNFESFIRKSFNSKNEFLAKIAKTNEIRNRVMHTIRMSVSREDTSFLEEFSKEIDNVVQGMC